MHRHFTETWAQVVDTGGQRGKGGDEVQPSAEQQQKQHGKGEDVDCAKPPNCFYYPIWHRFVAQFYREHPVRMQQPLGFARALLVQQQHPNNLHAAAG